MPRPAGWSACWIEWNLRLYRERGHGLWYLTRRDTGEFVGDCGLVPQEIDGEWLIEVGYHVVPHLWRRGYAYEAAAASRDYARDVVGVDRLIAIINPDNTASQGVARKIGLRFEREIVKWERRHALFGTALRARPREDHRTTIIHSGQ